jgi:hypothetical protein
LNLIVPYADEKFKWKKYSTILKITNLIEDNNSIFSAGGNGAYI